MSYLKFNDVTQEPTRKTKVVRVGNVSGEFLGAIHWKNTWRRYWFEAATGAGFDAGCLKEIFEKIESMMAER